MRKVPGVCGLMLVCVLAVVAQEKQKDDNVKSKPDLTGNWLENRAKNGYANDNRPALPLKITHRDPELSITHQYEDGGKIVGRDFVYYTDGRGETNPTTRVLARLPGPESRDLSKQVTRSKTRWSGNKLVTRSTLRQAIGGDILEFELIEEWKLSSDGKTLTKTFRTVFKQASSGASVFFPANTPDPKTVYTRLPD